MDISEAQEQFHRKELRWQDVNATYLASWQLFEDSILFEKNFQI